MRPIMTLTMCAYLAVAATPGLTASPAFLKLGGVDGESTKGKHGHKDEIEILSWSWGEAQAADALTDGLLIIRNTAPDETAKVSKVDAIAIKQTVAKQSGEKGGTEDINIGVGELQEARPNGGVRVAAGDIDGDGAAAPRKPTTSRATLSPNKLPSSGMSSEKRQHGWVTVSKPLDRGAVRVQVKAPWLGCVVGRRYPVLSLGSGAEGYELTDAVVSDCASESVSFNYAKVKVRGWNPETKQE